MCWSGEIIELSGTRNTSSKGGPRPLRRLVSQAETLPFVVANGLTGLKRSINNPNSGTNDSEEEYQGNCREQGGFADTVEQSLEPIASEHKCSLKRQRRLSRGAEG